MNTYKDLNKFENYIKNKKKELRNKKTYVFYSKQYDLYKIGHSKNPKQRIEELSKVHGKLKTIVIIESNYEVAIHRVFKDRVVKIKNEREWFDLSLNDIKWLKTINDSESIKFFLDKVR